MLPPTPISNEDKEAITFRLRQSVSELTAALLAKHPSLATLLKEIHLTIRKYPEQVTILTEEELNGIFHSYEEMSKITLANSVTAKKSSEKNLKTKIKELGTGAF